MASQNPPSDNPESATAFRERRLFDYLADKSVSGQATKEIANSDFDVSQPGMKGTLLLQSNREKTT